MLVLKTLYIWPQSKL